jgi:hypothetical protein
MFEPHRMLVAVANATAHAINALRGLPALANEELVSQASLLAAVAIPDWDRKTAEHGEGGSSRPTLR